MNPTLPVSPTLTILTKARRPETTRLNKFLRDAGLAARRKCEEYITAGRITVNGRTVTTLGTVIDPAADRVALDGRPVAPADARHYLLLNKPKGYLVSRSDPHHQKLVTRLLPANLRGVVFPVGRLDYNTSGALLLTNDGDLANRLVHPRFHVDKTYRCRIKGSPGARQISELRSGIPLDGSLTKKAEVKTLGSDNGATVLSITLREGRNRQIRRMCRHIGHPVIDLQRTDFAGLSLKGLKEGHWRTLTAGEVDRLKKESVQ